MPSSDEEFYEKAFLAALSGLVTRQKSEVPQDMRTGEPTPTEMHMRKVTPDDFLRWAVREARRCGEIAVEER